MNKNNLEYLEDFEKSSGLPGIFSTGRQESARRGFLLSRLPLSARLFVSLMLCVAGLCYAAFLGQIWVDTEMRVDLIIEGYGLMSAMELVTHSFRYLFWFVSLFSALTGLLFAAAYSERVKLIFAAGVPALIFLDIASAWLIRFHSLFAYVLYGCGLLLAVSFLALFVLIQRALWSRDNNGHL